MTEDVQSLSTSALAKKLGKTSRQMFAELEALGWIVREDEQWKLTAKGTFEGGDYRESNRFGTYVIWPESVTQHRALVNPDSQLLSATALGKPLGFSAVHLNRIFNELGWIEPHTKGWRLTKMGIHVGGRQAEDARSGVPYVLWPDSVAEHPALHEVIASFSEAEPADQEYRCLDGHRVTSVAMQQIDNWLYCAGVVHACERRLPTDEEAYCDFYIPTAHLYIEYWDAQGNPGYLAEKMRRKELYKRYDLRMIEVTAEDLTEIDDVLARSLLKLGIDTL